MHHRLHPHSRTAEYISLNILVPATFFYYLIVKYIDQKQRNTSNV